MLMASSETSPESWWDATRAEVFRLLSDLEDKSLAGMYKLAIDLMDRLPEDGWERSRLSSVGHCFREILNNLPEALNDVQGVPDRGHSDVISTGQISAAIEEAFARLDLAVIEPNADTHEARMVPIPAGLVETLTAFAAEHRTVLRRVARRDAATVLGRVDPTDPALVPWKAARDFFMSQTHLNVGGTANATADIPTDDEVRTHVSNIEASLRARFGAFFDTVESLNDLLDAANRQVGVPDPESAQ